MVQNTLCERLERRNDKSAASGDYRVCAAHDLAPIFEKAFDIKPKELAKSQDFLKLYERWGLELGENEVWKGVPKKSFQKKGRKH